MGKNRRKPAPVWDGVTQSLPYIQPQSIIWSNATVVKIASAVPSAMLPETAGPEVWAEIQ